MEKTPDRRDKYKIKYQKQVDEEISDQKSEEKKIEGIYTIADVPDMSEVSSEEHISESSSSEDEILEPSSPKTIHRKIDQGMKIAREKNVIDIQIDEEDIIK